MIMKTMLLFLLLAAACQLYADKTPARRLMNTPMGETWAGSKKCKQTVAETQKSIRAQMQKLGYKEKYEIKLDKKGLHILLLFVKGNQQRLFMIRRLDANITEYSWGDINAKK